MQYLQAGKHVIYWNIQNDAPNLGNVRGVYLVLRLTDETLQQVEEYKQKQKEEENKRILEQIRAQERQRIADSLAKIPVKKEEVVVEKTKSHTQFGITFGVGTSDALIENEDGSKPYEALMFNKEAVSWHAGIVLRTHLWSWLGLQGGVLYKEFKQAQKVVINSEVNEVYLKANYIQFPITLHLYLGRTFNIFGGYYFNQYQKAYTYEAGGKNETQWLAGVTGSEETILAEKGNGICAGLEFKGKHSALTFTYEMDKTNFTKEGIVYIPAKWTNTLLSANFSIFF
jgi:hypothetical protein